MAGLRYYSYKSSDILRWKSQGGAAFLTVVEQKIDDEDYSIFAPVFNEDYTDISYQKLSRDITDRLLTEPFVESELPVSYAEIERELKNGKKVIFFGTPCVISALKASLTDRYDNLLTADMVCKGAASSFMWNSFLNSASKSQSVSCVQINSKEFGCRESIQVQFSDNDVKNYEELKTGEWLTAFKSGLLLRSSCQNCEHNDCHNSDVTLTCLYNDSSFNDSKGVSFLSVNTEKGEELIDILRKNTLGVMNGLTEEQAGKFFRYDIPLHEKRDDFAELCYTHGYRKALCLLSGDAYLNQHYKKYALEYFGDKNTAWKPVNNEVWTQKRIDGRLYLIANGIKWNRIFLPVNFPLVQGLSYGFDIRLKYKTENASIRIMLADSTSPRARFINLAVFDATAQNSWVNVGGSFYARESFWKYIMLASTDFIGKDPYVCFERIRIWEE